MKFLDTELRGANLRHADLGNADLCWAATDAEVRAIEVAMIRDLRSNDPAVG